MCDCPLDLQFARALSAIEAGIAKRRWASHFTFAYIPLEAQKIFDLTATYQLDDNLVPVGGCLEPECPDNSKLVQVRFNPPFLVKAPPKEITASLFNECCGDKFGLAVQGLTHEGFSLKVSRLDGEKGKGWGQNLKVRWECKERFALTGGVPALVLDNVPVGVHMEKHKYSSNIPFWASSRDDAGAAARQMLQFMEDFQVGKLPLIVRSQPAPLSAEATRAGASKGQAIEVVGANFKELVLDATRDVLLVIYSPFCGASRAVLPLFRDVAKALIEVADNGAMVALFDKTQNDLPVTGIKVTHFPTVYYFPAGDFDAADYRYYDYADYNGSKSPHNSMMPHSHFTKEIALKFMFEHGRNPHKWPETLAKQVRESHPALYDHDHDHSGTH